jgi:prephenate dehydratase
MKIAIQGIPGSFHHQVAINFFHNQGEIFGFNTFEEVAKAVHSGEYNFGIMAIENSIAGAILPNYELIDRYQLGIMDEYYLPISHNFLCLHGQAIEDIVEVRSHPMAILQCQQFFSEYPHIKLLGDVDTASVAKRIQEEELKGIGAIASLTAAEIYGLKILARDIQTVKENYTRFIVLQRQFEHPKYVPEKASFKVTVNNQKGILAKMLTLMSDAGLDLSKIQSIPVIEKPWEYAFFMDTQFEDYAAFQKVEEIIGEEYGEMKVFGLYRNRK